MCLLSRTIRVRVSKWQIGQLEQATKGAGVLLCRMLSGKPGGLDFARSW